MSTISDELILKDLQKKLEEFYTQERQIKKDIEKTKIAIGLYSNGKIVFSSAQTEEEKNTTPLVEGYNKDGSWKEKIIFALKQNGVVMTTKEVTDFIMKHEPELEEGKVYIGVGANIFQMVDKKKLKGYKPFKMKGQYYGNPTWFEGNGKLLKNYEPKVQQDGW
ncbi:MAG: hypothetical protein ABI388_03465 [Bacteroidia bacterium]